MPNYEEMDPKKLSCVGATPRPPSGDILPNYEEMEPLAHKLNHQLTMQPATSGGGGCGDYTEMQPHRSSLVQTVIPFEPNGIAGAMADCHQVPFQECFQEKTQKSGGGGPFSKTSFGYVSRKKMVKAYLEQKTQPN